MCSQAVAQKAVLIFQLITRIILSQTAKANKQTIDAVKNMAWFFLLWNYRFLWPRILFEKGQFQPLIPCLHSDTITADGNIFLKKMFRALYYTCQSKCSEPITRCGAI